MAAKRVHIEYVVKSENQWMITYLSFSYTFSRVMGTTLHLEIATFLWFCIAIGKVFEDFFLTGIFCTSHLCLALAFINWEKKLPLVKSLGNMGTGKLVIQEAWPGNRSWTHLPQNGQKVVWTLLQKWFILYSSYGDKHTTIQFFLNLATKPIQQQKTKVYT